MANSLRNRIINASLGALVALGVFGHKNEAFAGHLDDIGMSSSVAYTTRSVTDVPMTILTFPERVGQVAAATVVGVAGAASDAILNGTVFGGESPGFHPIDNINTKLAELNPYPVQKQVLVQVDPAQVTAEPAVIYADVRCRHDIYWLCAPVIRPSLPRRSKRNAPPAANRLSPTRWQQQQQQQLP